MGVRRSDAEDEEADEPWVHAVSLEELGELVARWLGGDLSASLSQDGPPDDETEPLISTLVEMNRTGYWTDQSQPGQADGSYFQRAHVSGYCSESVANAICAAAVGTELVVLALPALHDSCIQIPISRWSRIEYTWAGGHTSVEEGLGGQISPQALAEVATSWRVEVVDPSWGRDDLLWEVVLTALRCRPIRELADYYPEPAPPGARLAAPDEAQT